MSQALYQVHYWPHLTNHENISKQDCLLLRSARASSKAMPMVQMYQLKNRLPKWTKKCEPNVYCLQETHLKTRNTHRLQVNGQRKIYHANMSEKKARVKKYKLGIQDGRIGKPYACCLPGPRCITIKLQNNHPQESCEDQLIGTPITKAIKKRPPRDWQRVQRRTVS